MEKLFNMIKERGRKRQIVPIDHITDLRQAIISQYEQGLIDEKLYHDQLNLFLN
jgi:hypothetical protein